MPKNSGIDIGHICYIRETTQRFYPCFLNRYNEYETGKVELCKSYKKILSNCKLSELTGNYFLCYNLFVTVL